MFTLSPGDLYILNSYQNEKAPNGASLNPLVLR